MFRWLRGAAPFVAVSLRGASTRSSAALPSRLFLGLDVNTRTTGFAVVSSKGLPIAHGFIDTHKEVDTLAVALAIKQRMRILKEDVERRVEGTWHVLVEDYLRSYRTGRAGRHLYTLANVNGMVALALHDVFDVRPLATHPRQVHAHFGLKANKEGDAQQGRAIGDMKPRVFDFITRHYLRDVQWERKRTGALKDHCYDVTDAYLLALYACDMWDVEERVRNPAMLHAFAQTFKATHGEQLGRHATQNMTAQIRKAFRKDVCAEYAQKNAIVAEEERAQ